MLALLIGDVRQKGTRRRKSTNDRQQSGKERLHTRARCRQKRPKTRTGHKTKQSIRGRNIRSASARPHIEPNQKKKCRRRLKAIKICKNVFFASKFPRVPPCRDCLRRVMSRQNAATAGHAKMNWIRNNCFCHVSARIRLPLYLCSLLRLHLDSSRSKKVWPAYFKYRTIIIISNNAIEQCSISNSVSVSDSSSSSSTQEFPFRYLKTKTNLQCRRRVDEERMKRMKR